MTKHFIIEYIFPLLSVVIRKLEKDQFSYDDTSANSARIFRRTRNKMRRKIARQSRRLRTTAFFCASRRVKFKFVRIMRATDGAVSSGKRERTGEEAPRAGVSHEFAITLQLRSDYFA